MEELYYKTKASVKEYIKAAEGYDGKLLIEKLQEYLPSGSSMLEIGSGPGTDWNILKKDYQVVGSDNSTEFLNYLISNNPDGKFIELDAVTLDTDQSFDGIYSNKVLHHLKDEELMASIKRQHELLNPGGIICHSFWKGEGSEIFKGLYVNYHSEQNLKDLFSGTFKILLLENYTEFEDDDSILLIARKK
jgi:SAM-dependent methyltransferase